MSRQELERNFQWIQPRIAGTAAIAAECIWNSKASDNDSLLVIHATEGDNAFSAELSRERLLQCKRKSFQRSNDRFLQVIYRSLIENGRSVTVSESQSRRSSLANSDIGATASQAQIPRDSTTSKRPLQKPDYDLNVGEDIAELKCTFRGEFLQILLIQPAKNPDDITVRIGQITLEPGEIEISLMDWLRSVISMRDAAVSEQTAKVHAQEEIQLEQIDAIRNEYQLLIDSVREQKILIERKALLLVNEKKRKIRELYSELEDLRKSKGLAPIVQYATTADDQDNKDNQSTTGIESTVHSSKAPVKRQRMAKKDDSATAKRGRLDADELNKTLATNNQNSNGDAGGRVLPFELTDDKASKVKKNSKPSRTKGPASKDSAKSSTDKKNTLQKTFSVAENGTSGAHSKRNRKNTTASEGQDQDGDNSSESEITNSSSNEPPIEDPNETPNRSSNKKRAAGAISVLTSLDESSPSSRAQKKAVSRKQEKESSNQRPEFLKHSLMSDEDEDFF